MFQPERQIHFSVTAGLAWLMWFKVAADIAIAALTGNVVWAACGCACSAVAATLHIRSFFCVFGARMREAYDMGREFERAHAERRRELHSI